MKKSSTFIILCCSLIVFLLSLSGTIFFVKKIADKNAHTSLVNATLEAKLKEKENRTLLEKKVTEAKAVHNEISLYFIEADTIDTFLNEVESLGRDTETNVKVENVTVLSESANTLSVKVHTKGQFSNSIKMLSLLENLPYNIHITSVYLNQDILQQNGNTKAKVPWGMDIVFTITHA